MHNKNLSTPIERSLEQIFSTENPAHDRVQSFVCVLRYLCTMEKVPALFIHVNIIMPPLDLFPSESPAKLVVAPVHPLPR
jgi:hypothetical protein